MPCDIYAADDAARALANRVLCDLDIVDEIAGDAATSPGALRELVGIVHLFALIIVDLELRLAGSTGGLVRQVRASDGGEIPSFADYRGRAVQAAAGSVA